MKTLEQLKPANKAQVAIYVPYYSKDKHRILPYAIYLYQQGLLEGQRQIEGGENIPFIATWFVSKLPAELTRCRIQFDGQADLNYAVTISNSEFIEYLIETIKDFQRSSSIDFPRAFYRKLLRSE